MNLAIKQQSNKEVVIIQRPECKILYFPKKNQAIKMPSMSCCKTDLLDWNFERGY